MKQIILPMAMLFTMLACNEAPKNAGDQTALSDNPLLKESVLPYGTPDFSKIKSSDFKPAILEGIRLKREAIRKIAEDAEAPTFDNTLVALEKSGIVLGRALSPFFALTGANTNDTLQQVQEEIAPLLSEVNDFIYLNDSLFQRVKTLYDKRNELNLDAESAKLLEDYYTDFKIAGAELPNDKKDELKKMNAQLATLSARFNKTLLAANNDGAVVFDQKSDLAGLTDAELDARKNKDGSGWKIPLQNTTQQPLLSDMENRDSRKKLFTASWERGNGGKDDTKAIITEIAETRAKKAQLLGFKNFAQWRLQKTMAKTPENVFKMFAGLVPSATRNAQAESDTIQNLINRTGNHFTLEPYDWNFFSEKVRKEKYDLDESQIKPYFLLKTVLEKGVFYAATQLYGITFKQRTDIPVYNPDVLVYEVFEEDGNPLGLFYGDYYARPSKRGGAWMSNLVEQSKLLNKKPVIYNVCNFSKPSEGEPALLTFDNVTTMFHEFGHALHGFFASQQYPSLSGTNVSRDFVEFPSQFNENWALYPTVLKNYAIHYKTGAPIPQELIDKIKRSATFNEGYALTENLAASNLDMEWHTISADTKIGDALQFEKEALHKTKLDVVHAVPPRYRSTYFSHIWGSGYAAGYYSYLWTEMLDHDAYQWFTEHGGLSRANGQRFRDMILSRGNTEDLEKMYRDWRGHDPEIGPMLKARGLK